MLDLLGSATHAGLASGAARRVRRRRPFSFPLQSVESPEVLDDDRLLIANDNDTRPRRRWIARDRPDDVELIVVRLGDEL